MASEQDPQQDDRQFEVPQGSFDIQRYPAPEPNLLGWDSADEYILNWVSEQDGAGDGKVCVINDRFGALAIALAGRRPQSWSDSHLAQRGLLANLERNGLDGDDVTFVPSSFVPEGPLKLVILKIPKALAELEDQLARLRPELADDAVIVAAGMTKHVHNSTIELFEKYIGPTSTSLAKKKARLIIPVVSTETADPAVPELAEYTTAGGLTIRAHGPVFSHESLDIGTRLLLDSIPVFSGGEVVVDLGSGSGVIGCSVLASSVDNSVIFTDESYLAVESSRLSAELNGFGPDRATFVVDDCGHGLPAASADVVLVNPPFHDRSAKSSETAKRMLREAKRILRSGGTIYVVGNRQLGYHNQLRRRFGRSENVKSNSKFSVLRATKR